MIQDIAPHTYHVAYQPSAPEDADELLIYHGGKLLLAYRNQELCYPTAAEVRAVFPEIDEKARFLFRMDTTDYYELPEVYLPPFDGWKYEDIAAMRTAVPSWKGFAGITGFQIHNWYAGNTYCGRCGEKLRHSKTERALECPSCGKILYPAICPSVIVAVTDGNRLLLTKYAVSHSRHRNYALVAGYAEVGETLEDTVRREVMEEVGLHVKNIRYYKSQPWSFSGALLAGFFCELDGSDEITLEEDELSVAEWFEREEIPPTDTTVSLTSEMMEYFREHGRDGI